MNNLPRSLPERKTCMPCRSVPHLLCRLLFSSTCTVNEKSCVMPSAIDPLYPTNSPIHQRCDGRPPKCGPCSTAKRELDCVFPIRPESRDKRNALPKGKACLSCRFVAQIPRSPFPRVHPPDPSSLFLPPGARKRSVLAQAPQPCIASSHPVCSATRNVMESGRFVAPVRVPVTASRASTMRAAPLPTPIQKLRPTRTLPFKPHTASNGPADQVNMTPPRLLHRSPHPHHLVAPSARRLPVRCPHRQLPLLPLSRSSVPLTSVNLATC